MSEIVLIIGKSGSGKSTSLKNLDPKQSVLVNTIGKSLPWKGSKQTWIKADQTNKSGNMLISDNVKEICGFTSYISKSRPEVTAIIIDDFQYILAYEFMRRSKEVGFQKFTDIGYNGWSLIEHSKSLRSDLVVIFLAHEDQNDQGEIKCKTIGKLLDDKITVEGMFTVVLRCLTKDNEHKFVTKTDGFDTVKSPIEMFTEKYIENDVNLVLEAVKNY